MKSLLVYINPKKTFADENNDIRTAEAQIENSLLFWKPKDILLVTNFDYEYKGVKAMVLDDELYCDADITGKASKINVIIYLLEKKILKKTTWFHDLDAFQLAPIDINLKKSVGFTKYEWKDEWNTGSIFFKPGSLPVFKWIRDEVYKYKINEEPALKNLTDKNFMNINSLYEKLNISYNIGRRNTRTLIQMAEKPIKVAHFPPSDKKAYDKFKHLITPELVDLINAKFTYIS